MPIALEERDISFMVVGNVDDYQFTENYMQSDEPTVDRPAHLRISNESNFELKFLLQTSGTTFWMRPGDCLTIPIYIQEKGVKWQCVVVTPYPRIQYIFMSYFSSREIVYEVESTTDTRSSSDYPAGSNPFSSSSGDKANTVATATLSGAVDKTTYLTGFEVTGSGATAALTVVVTVTGLNGGTLSYIYSAVAGVALENTPLIIEFTKPLPASALNTAISVSCPALGAGSAHNVVNVHGYQL